MGWLHTILFGGSGEGIQEDLENSYSGYDANSSYSSNDECNRVSIWGDHGWGHEQEEVLIDANHDGRVTWWQRITRQY